MEIVAGKSRVRTGRHCRAFWGSLVAASLMVMGSGVATAQQPAAKPAFRKAAPGKPSRMFINLKTMAIKTITDKEEAAYRKQLEQAVEAGAKPFYPDSQCLMGVIELVRIPKGTFLMGSAPGEPHRMIDEQRHEVRLTKDYWMGCFEVNQEQWRIVMKNKDKTNVIRPSGKLELSKAKRGNQYPIYNVSYDEALQFCRELTLMVRKQAAANRKKGGYVLPENVEFTLPTEAQWEYACRATSNLAFSSGEVLLGRDANFHHVTVKQERRVKKQQDNPYGGGYGPGYGPGYPGGPGGQKEAKADDVTVVEVDYIPEMKAVGNGNPNKFGVFDMHGNVWEWCKGAYYTYPTMPLVNPQGGRTGDQRVTRGGGWYSFEQDCRSARRQDLNRKTRQNNIGFRIVISEKTY